jgi:phage tail-like protein
MRGALADLGTPYPIHGLLPAVLQDDDMTVRFTSGLDDVLAPAIWAIDCLAAYLDPLLAPADFLHWLGTWLGEVPDENWSQPRQRRAVAEAVDLHRIRGTVVGLRLQLELASGGRAEIADSGGVSWSLTPDAELPGEDVPRLGVRVTVEDPEAVDVNALDAVIRAAKPAHVAHRLEVLGP